MRNVKRTCTYFIPILVFLLFVCLVGCSDGKYTEGSENEPPSAYMLIIDGSEVAPVKNESDAEGIKNILINAKKDELTSAGYTPLSVIINNDISVSPSNAKEKDIRDPESAINEYYSGGGIISYTVTLSETQTESIPFNTVYKNSSSYYEGEKVTSVAGKNGEKTLTYEVTYKDGKESSRLLVSETQTSPATDKVVLVGTKKSTASTGKYAFPLKSMYVTSNYGGRYLNSKYDYHLGVDLRASKGTSVYASDGGLVIFSGYMGSYGYLIQIQHDNGDVTYYAHLSSLGVSKGVRVYKGQYIAKSGATGNVTGAHLHFEIRRNGKTVNPLTLLPKF
jgi:murein DD-endopeptidase MepM/ murein hydrolase activator NlpD